MWGFNFWEVPARVVADSIFHEPLLRFQTVVAIAAGKELTTDRREATRSPKSIDDDVRAAERVNRVKLHGRDQISVFQGYPTKAVVVTPRKQLLVFRTSGSQALLCQLMVNSSMKAISHAETVRLSSPIGDTFATI